MKKFLLGTVGLVALGMAAPATAADMTYKAPPPAPYVSPIYDWTGFYIGGNGGVGWAQECRNNVTAVLELGCYDPSGAVAGGQIGYRWQTAGWVFGLEAQGDWADIHSFRQNLGNRANRLSSKIDAVGLFTGQLGWSWNSVLLYAKGGAAVVDQRFDFISNANGLATASADYNTRWGATAGAGIEVGFGRGWSVGLEYDHIFLGGHDLTFVNTNTRLPLDATYHTSGDVDLLTLRLNYRWGGYGSSVAPY